MMNGSEKSDSVIVAGKPMNKAERSAAELAKGRDQGECAPMKHAPDSKLDKRDTGVGSHTATFCRRHPRWEKLWGGRRRSWHLHRPHELMEVAPWPKSMVSAEA